MERDNWKRWTVRSCVMERNPLGVILLSLFQGVLWIHASFGEVSGATTTSRF